MNEIGDFRGRPHAELHVDGRPIHLHRSIRNAEFRGDHFVGHSLRKTRRHLLLTDRKRIPARLLFSAVGACIVVRLALRSIAAKSFSSSTGFGMKSHAPF